MTTIEDIEARTGEELGVSGWIKVTQGMIDQFAEVTGDHQFIHVDPRRARDETPFGGTIAHGYLTVSLLSKMGQDVIPRPGNAAFGINYGFDYLRFLQPVASGARIRGAFTLKSVDRSKPGQARMVYGVTVEIEGEEKPALVADWVTLQILEES